MSVFESVFSLMLESKVHRGWSVADIDNWILPAINLTQYRLILDDGKAVGYASWAYLRNEVASKFIKSNTPFPIEEWNCGKELWSIDFIAPYGHTAQLVRLMHELHGPGISKRAKDNTVRLGGKILDKEALWNLT
jgi:cytolysin-activating lysine-acyltransferase